MNQELTDNQIRAAFVARASGSPSPDLADRIHAAAASTKQERPLIALPGLGRLAPVRHLALAAALGATVLVVAGTLFFSAGGPPVNGPIVGPTAPPSATPSTPPSLTPGYVFTPESVVKVADAGILDIFQLATADSDRIGEVQPGTSVYIVAGPTTVDGDDWYQVKPFRKSDPERVEYPLGWVRVAHDDGRPALEPTPLECVASDAFSPANILDLTPTGAMACFGSDDITIVGRVFCMPNDDLPENLQHDVTGPFWLDDGRYCAFQDESGEPYFEIFGFPTDELPPNWRTADLIVTGHFDDPESADCTGLGGEPSLSKEEAVFECRLGFHTTGVSVAN
jgi:hypothetical protein